jgi:hypothetical protein
MSRYFLKTFLGQCLYWSFSTHKQCILSQKRTTALLCCSKKPYTLAGFEPGSAVSEANAMPTAPHRQGALNYILIKFFIVFYQALVLWETQSVPVVTNAVKGFLLAYCLITYVCITAKISFCLEKWQINLSMAFLSDSSLEPGLPDGIFSNQKYQFG